VHPDDFGCPITAVREPLTKRSSQARLAS